MTQIRSRAFAGAEDLERMQAALSQWTRAAGSCIYCHPGDMPHRLYNGMRGRYPLAEIVRLWEAGDRLLGFACCYPAWQGYDAQVHHDFRGSDLEREILTWAYQETYGWLEQAGVGGPAVVTDVMSGDPERSQMLTQLGYHLRRQRTVLAGRSLEQEIPAPHLPAGYRLRAATGFADAAQLAAVHRGAFGSGWTAEQYRDEVMAKPGYDPGREIVVEEADGQLAAFCVYWLDPLNRVGYFEPVGTHHEFQRRGLGRALLWHTMQLMRQQGMRQAVVMYEVDNPASSGLYHAVGFRPKCHIQEFARSPSVSQALSQSPAN